MSALSQLCGTRKAFTVHNHASLKSNCKNKKEKTVLEEKIGWGVNMRGKVGLRGILKIT